MGQEGQHRARIGDALSTTQPWKKATQDWGDEVGGHVKMSPATGISSAPARDKKHQAPAQQAGRNPLSAETRSNSPFTGAIKLPHCFGWKEALEIQLQELSE